MGDLQTGRPRSSRNQSKEQDMSKTLITILVIGGFVVGGGALYYFNSTTEVNVEVQPQAAKEEKPKPDHGRFEDRPVSVFPGVTGK